MANILPRIDCPNHIVDTVDPAAVRKMYLRIGERVRNDFPHVGYDSRGVDVSGDIDYPVVDTSIPGTFRHTYEIRPEGYTLEVDFVVLAPGEFPPVGLCLGQPKFSRIVQPGAFPILNRHGVIEYHQHIELNTPEPDWFGLGEDGDLVLQVDCRDVSDTVDTSRAGTYNTSRYIAHSGMDKFNCIVTVYDPATPPTPNLGHPHVQGATYDAEGIGYIDLPGGVVPVLEVIKPDGTVAQPHENFEIYKHLFEYHNPEADFILAIQYEHTLLHGTCRQFRYRSVTPEGGYPSIQFPDGAIDSTGVIHVCKDMGQAFDARDDLWAWDADKNFVPRDVVITPPYDAHFPGSSTHTFEIPASHGNPAYSVPAIFHIGIDACCSSIAANGGDGCGDGGDGGGESEGNCGTLVEDQVLEAGTQYFGQFDWPSPILRSCIPTPLGHDPGVDVPATIQWLERYEKGFNATTLVDPKLTMVMQTYLFQRIDYILTEERDHTHEFTDFLNRMHETPRVFAEPLFLRGENFNPPIPGIPAWWWTLVPVLITAADPAERGNIKTTVDFPTLIPEAPTRAIDMLRHYFGAL